MRAGKLLFTRVNFAYGQTKYSKVIKSKLGLVCQLARLSNSWLHGERHYLVSCNMIYRIACGRSGHEIYC